jgi:2-keto-myo-inositol isomerase
MTTDAKTPFQRGLHLNGATIMSTPTDRHVEIARRAGYGGVEVRAERLLRHDDELKRAATIVRPGEVWSLNGIQIKLQSNGSLRRDLIEEELPPRLEICRALDASFLLVVPPRAAAISVDAAVDGVRDGLSIIRDRASAIGCGVAFEFLGFGDCPINSPQLAARVVDGLTGVDLVIDSCHWHASGSQPLDGFPIDRVRMVHLNDAPSKPPREIEDADRVLPGLGVIRLPELLAALRGGGYRGPWSVETFNPAYWDLDPEFVAADGRERTERILGGRTA